MKVGVLALQGDFEAHASILANLGSAPVEVRMPEQLAAVDAMVIPGGESTTIRKLATIYGLIEPMLERIRAGMPVLGTCAGLIACAREIADGDPAIWPVADVTVRRNAYGRQAQSFETDVAVHGIGTMRAVFIRAPRIERVGDGVEVLAEHRGDPVVVQEGNVVLAAFHPELSEDGRLHERMLRGAR